MERGPVVRGAPRQRAILAAATELFLSQGFAATSTAQVVASAGASKQTLYRRFGDKEGLFRAVIEEAIAEAEAGTTDLLAEVAEGEHLEASLRRFARQHLHDVLQPHLMAIRRLVIAEADRFPSLATSWWERGPERAHASLAATFLRLRERGLLDVDDPRRAAEQFNWLVLSIPLHRALYLPADAPPRSDLDAIADDAVRTFLSRYAAP
jgi:AcrR family transcriptional regulator